MAKYKCRVCDKEIEKPTKPKVCPNCGAKNSITLIKGDEESD